MFGMPHAVYGMRKSEVLDDMPESEEVGVRDDRARWEGFGYPKSDYDGKVNVICTDDFILMKTITHTSIKSCICM